MLYRLAIAAALGLAALTAPADAQSTAQVLPSCGSASLPIGPGGRLYVDQTGNLCTAGGGGGGGGGSVTQGTNPWVVSGNSTANGSGNPIFTSVTNVVPVSQSGAWAASGANAAGTAASAAPVLVGGVDGSTVRNLAVTPSGAVYISGSVGVSGFPAASVTTTGVLAPPTAASGKITKTSVAISANTSTQLVAANANRIAIALQCASGGVSIDETGAALTGAGVGNGSLFIPANPSAYFTPPVATLTAVTAYTATAQTCAVTEYLR